MLAEQRCKRKHLIDSERTIFISSETSFSSNSSNLTFSVRFTIIETCLMLEFDGGFRISCVSLPKVYRTRKKTQPKCKHSKGIKNITCSEEPDRVPTSIVLLSGLKIFGLSWKKLKWISSPTHSEFLDVVVVAEKR